jgi:hypothetical protein
MEWQSCKVWVAQTGDAARETRETFRDEGRGGRSIWVTVSSIHICSVIATISLRNDSCLYPGHLQAVDALSTGWLSGLVCLGIAGINALIPHSTTLISTTYTNLYFTFTTARGTENATYCIYNIKPFGTSAHPPSKFEFAISSPYSIHPLTLPRVAT